MTEWLVYLWVRTMSPKDNGAVQSKSLNKLDRCWHILCVEDTMQLEEPLAALTMMMMITRVKRGKDWRWLWRWWATMYCVIAHWASLCGYNVVVVYHVHGGWYETMWHICGYIQTVTTGYDQSTNGSFSFSFHSHWYWIMHYHDDGPIKSRSPRMLDFVKLPFFLAL